jgi:hypothetical protein
LCAKGSFIERRVALGMRGICPLDAFYETQKPAGDVLCARGLSCAVIEGQVDSFCVYCAWLVAKEHQAEARGSHISLK